MAPEDLISRAKLEPMEDAPGQAVPEAPAASGAPPDAAVGEDNGLTIVGLGASAGGQEALARFLDHLPADSGLAFVIVQHLAPTHESLLVELLARHTPMTIRQAQEGMPVQPNSVYIIPPNYNLAVLQAVFHLIELESPRGIPLPIDYFFRSLAQDRKEKAVGIILSGAGSDGSLGLKAIKENGGLLLAQDPDSAAYDSMPRSAIGTGLVDFVLPPEQMPERLLAYVKHPYVQAAEAVLPPDLAAPDGLTSVFVLLRDQTGHDFSQYKRKTVARRIERRMALYQIESVEDYYRYLRGTPREMQTLFRELLIGVTSFFRDPDAFTALVEKALPGLFRDRLAEDAIRVWAPGCATGEEAYSIAMLLCEEMDRRGREFKVQVFATDLDNEAIKKARLGYYPASIAAAVGPERLQRFFVQVDDSYQVDERVRGMVLFAVQSIIKDPPFSRLDLISCRNVLIYLDPVLQKRVIHTFHYALKPGGFLFLGTSEAPDEVPHLFKAIERRQRLYQKAGIVNLQSMLAASAPAWIGERVGGHPATATAEKSLRETVEKLVLEEAPPCIVVNESGEILFIHGRTGKYLEVPAGEGVSQNAFRMAREGLKVPLAYAVHQAVAQNERIVSENVPVKTNGAILTVRLVVHPVPEAVSGAGIVLVEFREVEAGPPVAYGVGDKGARIAELERELQAMRAYLQSTVEELEAANEELKSTNEELQSANEEMETSREELQSVNEELVTVNAEHETKIEQLTRAKNDLENTLTQVDVGIIFLDRALNIRQFNVAATRVSHLIPSDIGRPLSHIVPMLKYDRMIQDAQAVFNTLVPREVELQAEDGRWYVMRIRPYRTIENLIDGVTLTFSEITEQKTAEAARERLAGQLAREQDAKLQALVDSIADEVWFCNAQGNLTLANAAATRTLGVESVREPLRRISEWLSGMNVHAADGRPRAEADAPLLRSLRGETLEDVEEMLIHPRTGETLYRLASSAPVRDETGEIIGAVAVVHDITRRKQAEVGLRRLAAVVRDSLDAITVQDFEGRILAWNPAAERKYGWSEAEALKMSARDLIPEDKREEVAEVAAKLAAGQGVGSFRTWRLTRDGRQVEVWLTVSGLADAAGKPYAIATTEGSVTGTQNA